MQQLGTLHVIVMRLICSTRVRPWPLEVVRFPRSLLLALDHLHPFHLVYRTVFSLLVLLNDLILRFDSRDLIHKHIFYFAQSIALVSLALSIPETYEESGGRCINADWEGNSFAHLVGLLACPILSRSSALLWCTVGSSIANYSAMMPDRQNIPVRSISFFSPQSTFAHP